MNQDDKISFLKFFFGSMSLYMVYLVTATSLKSNLFSLPNELINEPWFHTTLVDFYFNLAIISTWVIYKEKKLAHAVVWIIAFAIFGSIATAFYVFKQLYKLHPGDGFERVLLRDDYDTIEEDYSSGI